MTPPLALPVADGPRGDAATRHESTGPFVVNLCSSTTPMALAQPQDPELKRFKFFVSRRLEDGRERFRLHMGYFESLQEAEEWVGVAREFYPGAWAGEAPGKRLRAQSPASDEPRRPATPTSAPVVPSAAPSSVVAFEPLRSVPPVVDVPVLRAAATHEPAASSSNPPSERAPELVLELLEDAPLASSPRRAPAESGVPQAPGAATAANGPHAPRASSVPRAPKAKPVGRAPVPAAVRPVHGKADAAASSASAGRSNVREILASLEGSQAAHEMPRLSASHAPQPSESNLTDSQVMRILEGRRSDGKPAERDDSITLLKPDDTGTRRALKDAVAASQPVSFAVQLQWSVQPIDVAQVPPLAIFGAYTLYTVEGSRQGRRWFGLRLGFFSDAISAKQVAHYVRSEFSSVAVVPVSTQERGRASHSEPGRDEREATRTARAASRPSAPSPKRPKPAGSRSVVRDDLPEPSVEFQLIDDAAPAARPAEPKAAKPQAAAVSRRAPKSAPGKVRARERRSPQTLEETLEILGADQLEIDGRTEQTASGGRAANKAQSRRNSPFTKLLDRLSEKAHRGR
jgi:hypothetical protein